MSAILLSKVGFACWRQKFKHLMPINALPLAPILYFKILPCAIFLFLVIETYAVVSACVCHRSMLPFIF